jgi:DnaJ-class molecular chaperone
MIIDAVTIELKRTGEQAKLIFQRRPYGMELKLRYEQLDQLIAEFTHFSAQWRATTACDPYHVLGVPRRASTEEIQQAYRTRAKQDHPDTSARDTTAAMQQLNEAYEILSDPETRKRYDQGEAVGAQTTSRQPSQQRRPT